jgi:hypothetical protein
MRTGGTQAVSPVARLSRCPGSRRPAGQGSRWQRIWAVIKRWRSRRRQHKPPSRQGAPSPSTIAAMLAYGAKRIKTLAWHFTQSLHAGSEGRFQTGAAGMVVEHPPTVSAPSFKLPCASTTCLSNWWRSPGSNRSPWSAHNRRGRRNDVTLRSSDATRLLLPKDD